MEKFFITPEAYFAFLGISIICIVVGIFSVKLQKICQAIIIGCVCAFFVAYFAIETNSSFLEALVGTAIFFGTIALVAYFGVKWDKKSRAKRNS